MLARILEQARKKYIDIEVGDIGEVDFIARDGYGNNIFLYRVNSYCYILEEDLDFEWICTHNEHNRL
jgi:hypothetical protein